GLHADCQRIGRSLGSLARYAFWGHRAARARGPPPEGGRAMSSSQTPPGPLTIRLHPADNVVVARADLLPGTRLPGTNVVARAHIRAGHKIAVAPVALDEPLRKYDQIIGFATAAVQPGDHVHVHNCAMRDFDRDYAFGAGAKPTAFVPEAERATFQGIR